MPTAATSRPKSGPSRSRSRPAPPCRPTSIRTRSSWAAPRRPPYDRHVSLSRRSLLTLRFPEREGPPREPRPYLLPDGAPALMQALAPLSAVLREIAGEAALDLSAGSHTQLDALPHGD